MPDSSGPKSPNSRPTSTTSPTAASSDPMKQSISRSKHVVEWGCKCLNVVITGSAEKGWDEMSKRKGLQAVLVHERGEKTKHGAYVTYECETEHERPTRARTGGEVNGKDKGKDRDRGNGNGSAGDVWRMCWLCDTKLYKVMGAVKSKGDAGASGEWVEVDVKGVLYGDSLNNARQSPTLPFTLLSLSLPSTSSNFGRPPTTDLSGSALYPSSSPSPASRAPNNLIPKLADPFFLPPPFTPSHPHLHDLCTDAVSFLTERNDAAENEVRAFIESKSREMRQLQERVRGEVELMWEKYAAGPGREEREREQRERSRSVSVDRRGLKHRSSLSRTKPPTQVQEGSSPTQPTDNPILRESATRATGESLLSASISQNSYIPPPRIPPAVDNDIDELSRTRSKRGDERAIAMSYVINGVEEMAKRRAIDRRGSDAARAQAQNKEVDEDVENVEKVLTEHEEVALSLQDVHGKDSWIDSERNLAAMYKPKKGSEVNDDTPTGPMARSLEERDGHVDKGKKSRVTFQEPEDAPNGQEGADDDHVFDFELEDPPESSAKPDEPPKPKPRDLYQENIAAALAGGIPSHRAAYQRMRETGRDLYEVGRRRPTSSASGSSTDETNISVLATSMPVRIVLSQRDLTNWGSATPELERKTSLSERQGLLVPPLKTAMRRKGRGLGASGVSAGVVEGDGSGETTPGVGMEDGTPRPRASFGEQASGSGVQENGADLRQRESRSASISRDRTRDQAKSFRLDPGPVFEALGKDDGGDEDETPREDAESGTLRERFVPPHILARKESLQSGDVGWRSMVTE